jgi:hypothetical protein
MVKILYSNDHTVHVALNALETELVFDLESFKFNSHKGFIGLEQLNQTVKAFLGQRIGIKFNEVNCVAGF